MVIRRGGVTDIMWAQAGIKSVCTEERGKVMTATNMCPNFGGSRYSPPPPPPPPPNCSLLYLHSNDMKSLFLKKRSHSYKYNLYFKKLQMLSVYNRLDGTMDMFWSK